MTAATACIIPCGVASPVVFDTGCNTAAAACFLGCCRCVQLLRLLLGGNGCVARRGDWWERLAINLEHMGLAEQALEVRRVGGEIVWLGGGLQDWPGLL
jgi:hypothetical protein